MRLFVAVIPPEPVCEDLDGFLAPRRDSAPFRWTLPFQWHLTLAFLPDAPERRLDELRERLTRAAARRSGFALAIAGGGAFPGPARAKVLYAGVRATGSAEVELARLATGARAAAGKAGAEVQGGPFRAHLTLARMRRPVEATRWIRLLATYEGPEFDVTEIALVQSHLGEGPRKRPRYDVLDTFPLSRHEPGTH